MTDVARFHTAEDLRDSIESLHQVHGTGQPVIYWLLLLIVVAAMASLPLVKVNVSVGAPGQVRPTLERLVVVSAVAGTIRTLSVNDNQAVHKGEALLVFESGAVDARIDQNRRLLSQNATELADLTLLVRHTSLLLKTAGTGALTPASAFFIKLPASLQSAQYIRQHAVLAADLQRLLLQRDQARQMLERDAALHTKGLISESDFEQQDYAVEAGEREIDLTTQQTLAKWQADKVDHEAKQDDLAAQAEQLRQQKELYIVRAPVDGTALGFDGLHASLYLPAGQKLGEISPGGDLQADVYLSPRDIGFVHPGQRVNLQVDAFPYTEWGMLQGRVHDISQDFVQVGQQLAFRAVIDLDSTDLRSGRGIAVHVRRGMNVNARFILKRRTLFDLLYEKFSESLNPVAKPGAT
jgi:HlyD family secretion protein